ncbi:hypothetical protein KR093_010678, partial [Drosophila rubida]
KSPGVHQIVVSGMNPFDVLCDSGIGGPGFIVIYQRMGEKENFDRDWAAYREGFGSFDGDFFLGLEKIYRLTKARSHELFVVNGLDIDNSEFSRYNKFKISDESNGYALLSLGYFEGTKDLIRTDENMKFSTFDRDNDESMLIRCAERLKFGWWFGNCNMS